MSKTIKIYKASAGSGKTYRLAYEYVLLLFQNRNELHPHRSTLAVTFTNKATDEMKRRIVRELFALATQDDADFLKDLKKEDCLNGLSDNEIQKLAKRFLTDILYDYSSFNVSTIDGFFQQIVRAFTREIGLQGNFGVELDQDSVLQLAVDNMLFELDKAENRQLLEWLKEMVDENLENDQKWFKFRDKINQLGREIFKESYLQNAQILSEKLHDRVFLKTYRKQLNDIIETFEKTMQNVCSEALKILQKYGLEFADFSRGTKGFITYFDYDKLKSKGFEVTQTFVAVVDNCEKWYTQKSTKKNAIESAFFDGLNACAKTIVEADKTNYLSAKVVLENIYILGILTDINAQIVRYCNDKNALLISNTTDFLHKIIDGSDAPFIYEKTGVYLHHFMMDEFQDTSQLQWDNFRPLLDNSVAENRQNLVVGDVKQSIYRWRNSDWRLLQSGVKNAFGDERIQEETLGTNWRSARNIVEFNNEIFSIFSQLSDKIVQKNAELVKNIYANASQKSNRRNLGRVNVEFLPIKSEDETKWEERVMSRLSFIIDELREKDYALSDITILVRKNKEATKVADFLINAGYEVVSNEALLVANAPCVRLLVALMRFFVAPENTLNRMLVESLSNRQKNAIDAPKLLSENETSDEWLQRNFADKIDVFHTLKNKPLLQMVEQLILELELQKIAENSVFLQAFQDEIFNYTVNYSGDINGFLEYWDKVSGNRFLAASETQNAIRIMTIHKSKGLEFKAVIIPFCDWDFAGQSSTIWCRPPENCEPFSQLPIIPVTYKSMLANTIFAKDYEAETLYRFVDTLNLAYVAFTRPENDLYILAPKNDAETIETPKSIADFLQICLIEQNCEISSDLRKKLTLSDDENCLVQIGTLEKLEKKEKENEIEALPLTYDSVSAGSRLNLRYSLDDEGSERRYGLLLHDVLSEINTIEDIEKALKKQILSGAISENEYPELADFLARLLSEKEVAEWFSGEYRVVNETEIISPNADKTHRPDRVMIKGKKVIVVDYKFGLQKEKRYHAQVKKYMRLIAKMGYEASGYIWYARLGEIELVNFS